MVGKGEPSNNRHKTATCGSSMPLLYAARPMGTYTIPISMLLPPSLCEGYAILDPALCQMRGRGMEPWRGLVERCDRVVALTSLNVVTAGVHDELNHAHACDKEIFTPWLTERPRVLTIAETVAYNKFGTQICEPEYARGFCVWTADPRCPGLLEWRDVILVKVTN